MFKHPIVALDFAVLNILACHVNLFLGTLALVIPRRPDLLPLFQQGLDGEYMGNFLLTEVGHGLDITRLETVAEKVEDGFILRTPTDSARKFFPPTTPHPELPKVAVVFARLIEGDVDYGVHPFLIATSDPGHMCPGVSAILLPPRSGTCPLDYAFTSFDNIKLPHGAFLGTEYERIHDRHRALNKYVRRIIMGQIVIPMTASVALKVTSYIGVEYSFRRHVQGKKDAPFPIMAFRTQQIPVLYSVAVACVLNAWADDVARLVRSLDLEGPELQGMATVFKTTVCRLAVQSFREVGERLGGQGTYGHNFISQVEADVRGFIIAEGDVTTISIRLYSELLQRKYTLPACAHGDTILERHAKAIFNECARTLDGLPGGHRDPGFNDLLLPQCERGVFAIGCSYAYSSALDAGVPRELLDLFECAVVRLDPAWYAENESLGEKARISREKSVVDTALPRVREYVRGLNVREVVRVPIASDDTWSAWVEWLGGQRSKEASNRSDVSSARLSAPPRL